MGSIAPSPDYAKALILEIQRINKESIARSGEIDLAPIVSLLETSLDDLLVRPYALCAIADIVSRSLAGNVPDLTFWRPPKPRR